MQIKANADQSTDPVEAGRKALKVQKARETARRKAKEAREAAARKTREAATPIGVDEYATAAELNLSVHTLRKDRQTHRRIPFYRIGNSVRYNLDRVREALAALEEGVHA